jgi:hypothetical protein
MTSMYTRDSFESRHFANPTRPYVPPRQAWADKGRSSPLNPSNGPPVPAGQNHTRQLSGEYFEDVDPRFADHQSLPTSDIQRLPSSNVLPPSLTPGYATSSNGPGSRDPNLLGHPSSSNPHLGLNGNNSYEDVQSGSRSPAESERSNFTSVSQRGVNPRWNPQRDGPGGFGPPMMGGGNMNQGMGRRPVAPPQRNNDILLDTNPDFGLPGGRGGRGGANGRSPIGGGMVPRSAYEGGNGM